MDMREPGWNKQSASIDSTLTNVLKGYSVKSVANQIIVRLCDCHGMTITQMDRLNGRERERDLD